MLEPEDALLADRVHHLAGSYAAALVRERPDALVDPLLHRALDAALGHVVADEGTLWLACKDDAVLMPVWNNGPDASQFIGSFQLPVSDGITGMVYTTGLSACESEVCFQPQQHRKLDESLHVLTWAMLAVPLKFLSEVRGVLTAVKLIRFDGKHPLPRSRDEWPDGVPVPTSFSLVDLGIMEHTALLAGRLIEHRLTRWALGEDA